MSQSSPASDKDREITLKLPAGVVGFIVDVISQVSLPYRQTAPVLDMIRAQYAASMSPKEETSEGSNP